MLAKPRLAVLVAAALLSLASCSRGSGPVEDRSEKDKKLYIYNWS